MNKSTILLLCSTFPLLASLENAEKFLQNKDYFRAKSEIDLELKYNSTDLDTLFLAGQIALACGNVEEALFFSNTMQQFDHANPKTRKLNELIHRYQMLSEENKLQRRRKANLQQGEELEIMGEQQQALEFFLKEELKDPDYPPYLFQIGLIYSQRQEWNQAEEYLKATLYHNPGFNEARIALAEVYFWQHDSEKAQKQIELALNEDPENVNALRLAGQIFYEAGYFRKAREFYLRLLKKVPGDMTARLALKRMKGKFLLEKHFKKENILSEHRIPMMRRADQFALEAEYEKALYLYQYLLKQNPEDSWLLYKAGLTATKMENWGLAKQYFQNALIEDPYNHDARVGLGSAYYRDGNLAKAIEQADIVLKQNPENSDALLLAGRSFVAEGMEEKGRQYFETALQENPNDREANQLLAQSYDLEKQRIYIKPVLEQAEEYEKIAEYEKALELYLELYRNYPDDIQIIYQVGRAYSFLQNYTVAENYLLLCLSLNPGYDDARIALSYVYYWQKEYEKALEQANFVLKNNPNNIDALIAAARSYRLGSNIPKAEEYLEKALSLNPNYYDAILAMAQLKGAKREYMAAYLGYLKAHQKERLDPFALQGAIKLRPLVNPSIKSEGSYGRERENDLIEKIFTTEMNVIDADTKITFPVNDRIIPYMSYHFNQTEQYNAISRLNNYNIDSYMFTYGADVLFGDFWTANLKTTHHWAENVGNTLVFPFQNRYLWEPTAMIKYQVPKQNFQVGAFKDTIIARLFSNSTSKLLSNKQLFLFYEYLFFPPYTGVGAYGKTGLISGSTKNRENVLNLHFKFRIPSVTPILLVRGEYHYRGFKKVLRDYNSFKRRVEYEGILTYIKEWVPTATLELRYRWLWSKTEQLTDQSEVIVAGVPSTPQGIPVNIFRANIFEGEIRKVFGTKFHFNFLGRYYHNTNEYRAWLLKSSLQYVF